MSLKFEGLTTHKRTLPLETKAYPGEPCLYHAHSGTEGAARTWRDAETHACLECLEEIKEGKFALGLDLLAETYRRRAFQFWSNVSIESLDDCWKWNAPPLKYRQNFTWRRPELRNNWRHHPILVLMWLTYGDIGRMGTVSLCGNRRCCNPLHNIPLAIADRGSYLDMSHVETEVSKLKRQIREVIEKEHVNLLGLDDCEENQADVQDGLIKVPNSQRIVSNYGPAYEVTLRKLSADATREMRDLLTIG